MSWLSDNLSFEKFQLGDWWKKIKANPEQLLLGAGDPFSAKVWGGITGKDYEPFVDQMGGPYGGNVVSAFGANKGGVYGRAEDAGINTGPASNVHDVAHVVAAIYGGKGLMGIGGAPAGAAQTFPLSSAPAASPLSGSGVATVAPAAGGGGGAAGGAASPYMKYSRFANMGGGGGGQASPYQQLQLTTPQRQRQQRPLVYGTPRQIIADARARRMMGMG